ncbi:MAG TPA: hypothetical protein VGM80_07165 [Gaiellaceae bacterium]|jgi:hypothetical protein
MSSSSVEGDDLPATPPADVLDALDRAARVLGELDRKNISLSLHHDDENHQVRVSVTHPGEPAGHELSATALLNLLDGDTSEIR